MDPAFSSATPQLWGRLASVRRVVAWAASEPGHAHAARYLGLNCARLLEQALGELDEAPELKATVEATRGALLSLDHLAAQPRAEALRALEAELERLMPLSQAGARVAGLEPAARLFAPIEAGNGRGPGPNQDRARPEGRAGDAPRPGGAPVVAAEVAPPAEAPAPAAEPSAADQRPQGLEPAVSEGSAAQGSPAPAGGGRSAEGRSAEGRPAEGRPAEGRPAEGRPADPDAGRLPLGHSDGTGAPLTGVDALDPDLVERLDACGIGSFAEALMYPPSGFHRPTLLTGGPVPMDPVMVRGRVVAMATRFAPGRRYAEVTLQGPELRVVCRWQGALPWRCAGWHRGAEVAVVGTLAPLGATLWSLDDPEPVGLDGRGSGLLPEYGLEGVTDREMRDLVARGLHGILGGVRDPLPEDLLERHRLLPLDEALRDAHFPANAAGRGRYRLAFEELLALQIALARRTSRVGGERGMSHKVQHSNVGQLHVQFSLALGDEQEAAYSEIRRDLIRPIPMARVLLGDVGVAKGLVALLTAVLVADNRTQVAIICPTASAAERQYLFGEPMLRAVGAKALLVGDTVTHASADAIRRGDVTVVFATPRVLTGDLEWRRLGLVILVEHRTLGALHPSELDGRGPRPDMLVVTAGPLPPSLLLGPYAGFDLSVIRRTTPARVAVRAFATDERDAAYALVREQLAAGRQAYVVFPSRNGLDAVSRDEAMRIAEMLRGEALLGAKIGVFSSDMPREERARVVDDFSHRRFDVLLSTTAIEDGPPVANATVVLVELADRFDLIRLHRLRTHVGHGPAQGHCLLVRSNDASADGAAVLDRFLAEPERLQLTDDDLDAPGGPRLAESAGAIEPPPLTWAEMPRDLDLLVQTRALALRVLREDATLRRCPGLRRVMQERWPELQGEPDRAPTSAAAEKSRRRRRRRRRR